MITASLRATATVALRWQDRLAIKSPQFLTLSLHLNRVSSADAGYGLLGVYSRYGLHTRADTVYRGTLTEGFSHFVTSMTAPDASGWSIRQEGLTPTGKRRLSTAHTQTRQFRFARRFEAATI
jgi:hypothetical protein